MIKKIFLAGVAALFLATGTAHARFLGDITCDGTIEGHSLRAYTQITSYGEDIPPPCIFITRSRIGRKILRTCPKNSLCLVKADIESGSREYEIIRLISVKRIFDTYVKEPPCELYKDCGKGISPYMPPPKIPMAH
jgi:hypothetical protein